MISIYSPSKPSPKISSEVDHMIIDLTNNCKIIDLTSDSFDEDDDEPIEDEKVKKRKEREEESEEITEYHLRGTPICNIKSRYPLFFTYDPRGVEKTKKLPAGHCKDCRCPINYCAEAIFGQMVIDRCEHDIYLRVGIHGYNDDYEIEELFKQIYTDAVKNKMMWNRISFTDGYNTAGTFYVPGCMRFASLANLMREFRKEKDSLAVLKDVVVPEVNSDVDDDFCEMWL
jgi:hypothetical protein